MINIPLLSKKRKAGRKREGSLRSAGFPFVRGLVKHLYLRTINRTHPSPDSPPISAYPSHLFPVTEQSLSLKLSQRLVQRTRGSNSFTPLPPFHPDFYSNFTQDFHCEA